MLLVHIKCILFIILLQADDTSDPHKDIENDEVLSDPPTVKIPSNDDHTSDDGNQDKDNASVCLYY